MKESHRGTLFLATQVKLLRVLQEKTIQRLGDQEPVPVDVRMIAATHRDLERAIEQKLFRATFREVLRPMRTEAASHQTLAEIAAQMLGAAQRGESDNAYAEFHAAAERELFSQAMRIAGGNKTKAARWLGIARLTLREKLHALGLERSEG